MQYFGGRCQLAPPLVDINYPAPTHPRNKQYASYSQSHISATIVLCGLTGLRTEQRPWMTLLLSWLIWNGFKDLPAPRRLNVWFSNQIPDALVAYFQWDENQSNLHLWLRRGCIGGSTCPMPSILWQPVALQKKLEQSTACYGGWSCIVLQAVTASTCP